jgi:outer membrane lipoprotein-sorting protein
MSSMTVLTRHPVLRWLVPLLVAVVLAAGGSAVGVITAAAHSGLAPRSASRLLVDVQRARLDGLSGTIVQNADLGLPALPDTGGSGSSNLSSLVTGSHTLRVWYAGPDRFRLALLGSLGESDVVRNGPDLWTWSSTTKSASHRVVPLAGSTPRSMASASPLTPQRAAREALRAINPSTRVRTDGTAMVAGRSAYELLLQPRDRASLVDSVRIAIDGRTHVPTRVQVFARGVGKPAFEVGFTSFNPTRPDASVFRFNPPAGTKVTQGSGPAFGGPSARHLAPRRHPGTSGMPGMRGDNGRPHVVGRSWTSVLVTRVPPGAVHGVNDESTLGRVLRSLPRASGSWGSGRVLRGTLFSAVLTDDGRLAVGAVRPDRLYAALAQR